MKFYYVNILRCNDNSLYGVTSNIERRVVEHNEGKYPDTYTYSKRPVELVFYENFTEPNQAIEFEKKIKKWSRTKKQALIDGNFDKLQNLSECRNASHHKYNPDNEENFED